MAARSAGTPPPGPRPGRTRSETARRAILEATRDQLAEHGYDKLSIDRVAAAAGVGKQTVYRWYPSKSALVAEGILLGYVFSPGIDIQDSGDVRRDITAWARAFADYSVEPGAAALVRAATAATAEDADVAARFQEQITGATQAALAGRLRRGVDAGQLTPGAPVDTAAETIVGALIYRILTRQALSPAFVAELVDTVFQGIQA
ncbi:TetR/AcrR family transcriptional regulator [Nocardia sp. NPDC050712]|uniref:TetR/AcrR family transcriptional regulator n=1 Tax=Nocardia sp. NPDC050712 TaxID=3155518 RepID=UPI0033D95912